MSKLTGIKFYEHGAKAEQDFKELVDRFLKPINQEALQQDILKDSIVLLHEAEDRIEKIEEDGMSVTIWRKANDNRGLERWIELSDNEIIYQFVLYPIACDLEDAKAGFAGLKYGRLYKDDYEIQPMPDIELTESLDSGDFANLKRFVEEVM